MYKSEILWAGIGLTAFLHSRDVSPFVAQSIGLLFFGYWCSKNISTRTIVLGALTDLTDIFFREIYVRGNYKVDNDPRPVLFCCGPHSNQFIDDAAKAMYDTYDLPKQCTIRMICC